MAGSVRVARILALALAATVALGALAPAAEARLLRRERMLQLINDRRVARDVGRLDLRSRITRVAKEHSREMAAEGELFHTESLSRVLRYTSWRIAGENVGAGGDVESLFRAFMDSASHRRNLLRDSFRHVGIGMVSADGYLWVTMIFYG
jgi:uncharacterized protein YkwD